MNCLAILREAMSAWALFDHPDAIGLVVIGGTADRARMGRNWSKTTRRRHALPTIAAGQNRRGPCFARH